MTSLARRPLCRRIGSLIDGYLLGPYLYLYGADLAGADLSNVDLYGANLDGVDLRGADLENTNLGAADLAVDSGGIAGTPTALPVNWNLIGGYLFGPNESLTGVDMSRLRSISGST